MNVIPGFIPEVQPLIIETSDLRVIAKMRIVIKL